MSYDTINFKQQAEQMLRLIEGRLPHDRTQLRELLELKFKALFEQGLIKGRRDERNKQNFSFGTDSLPDDEQFY